jgi:hypothetical protein
MVPKKVRRGRHRIERKRLERERLERERLGRERLGRERLGPALRLNNLGLIWFPLGRILDDSKLFSGRLQVVL